MTVYDEMQSVVTNGLSEVHQTQYTVAFTSLNKSFFALRDFEFLLISLNQDKICFVHLHYGKKFYII